MNYVGTDTADTKFYVQEVWDDISQLRQVWKYGKGRKFTDTPDYQIGFLGCYACGQEDHNQTDDFPLNRSGQFNKRELFR